jgi:hypothetical protein
MKCAHCGSLEIRHRARRDGLYPVGCVAVFGLPLAMLHYAAAPREYQCHGCGRNFSRRTIAARIAYVFLVVLATICVVALLLAVISIIRG